MNVRRLSIVLICGVSAQTGFCFNPETLAFFKENKRLPKTSELKQLQPNLSQVLLSMLAKDLNGANFSSTDLSNANFSKAELASASFADSNLSGANFSGLININNADFMNANLSGATHGEKPVTKEWLKSMGAWNVDSVKGIPEK